MRARAPSFCSSLTSAAHARFDLQRSTFLKSAGISNTLGSTAAVDTEMSSELIVMTGIRPSAEGAAGVAAGVLAPPPPLFGELASAGAVLEFFLKSPASLLPICAAASDGLVGAGGELEF